MSDLPEDSEAAPARGWVLPAVILLVLAIGFGAYSLGRRSQAGTPAAAQQAPGAAAPVTGRRFAPRDTFYLLDYVSAKTATGVIGFEPGQQVHLVAVHPATQTLVVGDEEAQVEVGPEKLTNDLDVAALARQNDQANQAKIASYVQAEQAAHAKFVREAAKATAEDIENRKEEQKEQVEEAREAAQDRRQHPNAQSEYASNAGVGGYYDDGGYGYGSPYAYFVNNASPGTVSLAAPAKALPNQAAVPARPAAPPAAPAPAAGAVGRK